jgi:hypothetical protein
MFTLNGIGTTIYGRAKRHELTGADRLAAEQAGYRPTSYQVVKWFVLLFLPIVPLGTYRVLKVRQKYWTDPARYPFRQYSMRRVDWDWRQVGIHYAVAYGAILVLLLTTYFKL